MSVYIPKGYKSILNPRQTQIGEVQSSVWDEETLRVCADAGITLL